MNKIYLLIAIIAIIFIGYKCSSNLKTTTINNVKIIKLVDQMKVEKEGTYYKYLIITNKGTFKCEDSYFNGKFNNSEMFYTLKQDSTYKEFKVQGFGKGIFNDYQNLIEVK